MKVDYCPAPFYCFPLAKEVVIHDYNKNDKIWHTGGF